MCCNPKHDERSGHRLTDLLAMEADPGNESRNLLSGLRHTLRGAASHHSPLALRLRLDEDSKGQRKMEDFGGGLLPAVEGHSLE